MYQINFKLLKIWLNIKLWKLKYKCTRMVHNELSELQLAFKDSASAYDLYFGPYEHDCPYFLECIAVCSNKSPSILFFWVWDLIFIFHNLILNYIFNIQILFETIVETLFELIFRVNWKFSINFDYQNSRLRSYLFNYLAPLQVLTNLNCLANYSMGLKIYF